MADIAYRYLHLVRSDCPLPPGTHVVVYCRDSGGEEQDRSVAQQVEAAREYCQAHNLALDEVYLDEARQSSNTEKREALQSLLADLHRRFKRINDRYKRERVAREHPYGVIFWKSSRLGRDSIEATNIKTDLRLRGITVLDLVTSATTGNAAIDSLIEAFQQWQDEQALDEISHNARRGLAQLVGTRDTDPEFRKHNPAWPASGEYLGIMPGGVPRGFKGERVQIGVYKRKKGRTAGEPRVVQRLVPDPQLWDRCRLAWEMRHQGASYGEIHTATRLFRNINGYDTFFANRIYTGDLEYGGTVYERFVPALIPREWYEEEVRRRAERARKRAGHTVDRMLEPGRVGSAYLLTGLVFCGAIEGEEHPMNIESIPAKQGQRGRYTFVLCTRAKNSRGTQCRARRVSLRVLERAVTENLLARVLTVENLRPLAEAISAQLATRNEDATVRHVAVESRLAEVRASINNLVDGLERMGYAGHLRERYDARVREEAELVSELARLDVLRVSPRHIAQLSDDLLAAWINHLRAALQGEDAALAQRTIRSFVQKVVIKEEAGTLYYTFPLPDSAYMSSTPDLDLRGFEPLTSTVRL